MLSPKYIKVNITLSLSLYKDASKQENQQTREKMMILLTYILSEE